MSFTVEPLPNNEILHDRWLARRGFLSGVTATVVGLAASYGAADPPVILSRDVHYRLAFHNTSSAWTKAFGCCLT
jgi:hypothetical protein